MNLTERENETLQQVNQLLEKSPFDGWLTVAQAPNDEDMISISSGGNGISNSALINGMYDSAQRFARQKFNTEMAKTDFLLSMTLSLGISPEELEKALQEKQGRRGTNV